MVFAQVPGITTQGAVVQNPDGQLMYASGAPYAPPQQQGGMYPTIV